MKIRSHLHIFVIVLLFLATLSLTQAQEQAGTEGDTGSGATLADPWAARMERTAGFLAHYEALGKQRETFRKQKAIDEQRLEELRVRCGGSIRRANRDTKFPTIVQCLRNELALEREMLRRERRNNETLPGVSEETRTQALASADALLSALTTFIDGLDAGVFRTTKQIMEARDNLREQYRTPSWLSLRQLRAEHALSWTSHFLVSLRAIGQDPAISQEAAAEVARAADCFVGAEALLESVPTAGNSQDAETFMSQAETALESCSESARSLTSMATVQNTSSSAAQN
ncbi:MAG: hypothetical protein PHI23_03340 [Candidatus Peribacteraceae bacterium]|nr:hypothetical protein [Candidatus Peribacteraceae bacterium]